MSQPHDHLFLIEGTLSELQTARGKIDLLRQIDQHVQSKSLVTGAVAALSGLHGQAAQAVSLALYDGEDVYHFAAALGEQVICGTFEHANNLKNGDPVKAVVSKAENGVLFVHAIMHAKTEQFYMPVNTFAGDGAFFKQCMGVAKGFTIFGWVFSFITVSGLSIFDEKAFSLKNFILFNGFLFLLAPLIMYPMELWTYHSMKGGGAYAEAIFKTFGFPNPRDIDLTKVGCMNHEENNGWQYAFQAQKMRERLLSSKPTPQYIIDEDGALIKKPAAKNTGSEGTEV